MGFPDVGVFSVAKNELLVEVQPERCQRRGVPYVERRPLGTREEVNDKKSSPVG